MNGYERWALLVAGAVSAPKDPRTLGLWARHVGVGATTIRARCRVAGVAVLSSRDLGRLLRVVARSNLPNRGWDPAAELESCDPRTLRRLLVAAGLADWPTRAAPPSIEDLLTRQSFVPVWIVPNVRVAVAAQMRQGAVGS